MALALLILSLLLLARAIYVMHQLEKYNLLLKDQLRAAHNSAACLTSQSILVQHKMRNLEAHCTSRGEALRKLHQDHRMLSNKYEVLDTAHKKLKCMLISAQYGGGPLSDGNGKTRVVLL